MRKSPSIVFCALAAAAAALPAMAEDHADPLKSRWSFRVELEERYDDNITELSDRDKGRVGDPAFANRFKIDDPGDYAWTPSARLGWSANLAKRLTTSVQLDARVHRYVRSSVKDYETFGLRVAQDLSQAKLFQTQLVLRVSDTPDYYLRELRVPGTTTYESARFSSLEYGLALEQVLVPKLLEATVQGSRNRRDYDAPFNERDGDLTGYGAALELGPGGSHAGLRVGYEKSRYGARSVFLLEGKPTTFFNAATTSGGSVPSP